MRRSLLLLALVSAFAESPSDRIGSIDFFGYGHLDLASLRAALPFAEGDKLPSNGVRDNALHTIGRLAGRQPVFSGVCCLPDGRSSIFIGLPEGGAAAVTYNPVPHGDVKLPSAALKIFTDFDKHLQAAVKKGAAAEDDSQGYALFEDPATHADQLRLRDWTRAHPAIVLQVLAESRDAGHRAYAAQAMGYAERSAEQIAALVFAAFDSNDEVRNNAVRALGVLCAAGPDAARQISAERFIPLLHSLSWTDRNKGTLLFLRMTESRDPALLKMLHDQALDPLREMAQWKDFGHAQMSLTILGRIAGIDEVRLGRLDQSMAPEILRAAK